VHQLELRLVKDGPEVAAAQRLRYRVFYEEMGALPSPATRASRIDADRFDALADHLVAVDLDRSTERQPCVVGCCRVLRESVAEVHGGFYTAQEFDLGMVRAPRGELMELGRSCVAPDYRNGVVMQLLWRGIADCIDSHHVGLMLGCASLPGTDPEALRPCSATCTTTTWHRPGFGRAPCRTCSFPPTACRPRRSTAVPCCASCRRCSRPTCGWAG
jgi:putative hemolysin